VGDPAPDPAPGPATGDDRPAGTSHARRLAYLCIALTVISMPIAFWVLGPNLPPGTGSFQDDNQVWVNRVILAVVVPIYLCVVAGFIYSFVAFRKRADEDGDAAPVADNRKTQRNWIAASACIVFFLWGFGTYEWIWAGVGSGGGQGPVPLVKPAAAEKGLEVQVIAQQWAFTYRYPSYGGMETPHLVLPEGTTIEMHVTSLDVIHSFWPIELGAKADAVPGFDNILYLEPLKAGPFKIKCAELCGLWHGQMYDSGQIMSASDFDAWATQQEKDLADITQYLPAYAYKYFPKPQYRG
jgi:cytochrome c oxidase subunit II